MPTKDENGIDTYDNSNNTAPVQAIIGMAGFSLDKFPDDVSSENTCLINTSFISWLVN